MTRHPVSHADALHALRRPRRPVRTARPPQAVDVPTVEWRDPSCGLLQRPLDRARTCRFETAAPVRGMPAFKGQWSKPGRYWFSGCGAHISYESRFERQHLILLDFDPRVVAVAGQPFRLHFARSTAPYRHVPDLFVRHVDDSALVIDVKGALAAGTPKNREVFARTAAACTELGLAYKVASEPHPTLMTNVAWLAGYRRPQHLADDLRPHLLDAVTREAGLPLGAAVAAAARSSHAHPAVIRPVLFHLMWQHAITTDLTQMIDDGARLDAVPRPESGRASA